MYSLSALLLIGGVVASFRVYQYTEHEMDRSFFFLSRFVWWNQRDRELEIVYQLFDFRIALSVV